MDTIAAASSSSEYLRQFERLLADKPFKKEDLLEAIGRACE
jgi:hypothetical protein